MFWLWGEIPVMAFRWLCFFSKLHPSFRREEGLWFWRKLTSTWKLSRIVCNLFVFRNGGEKVWSQEQCLRVCWRLGHDTNAGRRSFWRVSIVSGSRFALDMSSHVMSSFNTQTTAAASPSGSSPLQRLVNKSNFFFFFLSLCRVKLLVNAKTGEAVAMVSVCIALGNE